MADILRTGLAWLSGQLKSHAGQTVTYIRAYDEVELTATLGSKPMRLADEFGARLDWTGQDFLIAADDLILDGDPQYPARGDLIVHVVDDTQRTYEVLSPGGTEPPWRWSDPHHTTYRVHTKLIEQEPYS